MTSLWPLFSLKFGQTRILFRPAETNLGPLCLFRYLTSVLSRPARVWAEVWLRTSRALIRLVCLRDSAVFEGTPGSSHSSGSSICSGWRRRAKIMRVGAYCSALEFWRKISAKTRLLQTCLTLHRRGGWDGVGFIRLKIGNATGERGCLCRKAWSLADLLVIFML